MRNVWSINNYGRLFSWCCKECHNLVTTFTWSPLLGRSPSYLGKRLLYIGWFQVAPSSYFLPCSLLQVAIHLLSSPFHSQAPESESRKSFQVRNKGHLNLIPVYEQGSTRTQVTSNSVGIDSANWQILTAEEWNVHIAKSSLKLGSMMDIFWPPHWVRNWIISEHLWKLARSFKRSYWDGDMIVGLTQPDPASSYPGSRKAFFAQVSNSDNLLVYSDKKGTILVFPRKNLIAYDSLGRRLGLTERRTMGCNVRWVAQG